MIWRHEGCTSKRAHVPPAAFSPKGPEGPRGKKKKISLDSKQMMTKGEQENQTVLRNVKAPRRHGGRGAPEGSAAGFSPVPEHPWPLGSRPLPAGTRGEGGLLGGRHILRPGLGVGWGRELSIPAGPPGGDPGPQRRSPPSRTPPCGPARPPQRPAQVSP